MKLLSRLGWVFIAIGAVLFLSTITPLGLILILLGAPAVFFGATGSTLRARRQSANDRGGDA